MSEIDDQQFRHDPARADDEYARLYDVSVELAVEIGRTRMTIRETLALAQGSIIALNRLAGEPVDLLVNGRALARGEVVVIDEEFGLRVTEILPGAAATAWTPAPAAPAAQAAAGQHADEAAFASFDEPAAFPAPVPGA